MEVWDVDGQTDQHTAGGNPTASQKPESLHVVLKGTGLMSLREGFAARHACDGRRRHLPAQTRLATSRVKVRGHVICVHQVGPIIVGGRASDVAFVTSVPTSVSTPNRFEFCCCATCVSPSPLRQTLADVAVSTTCLAITDLRALSRACWEEGALPWSLLPGCGTFS